MTPPESMYEFDPKHNKDEKSLFVDKFKDLLPGIAFEEPMEMLEARTAVIEALLGDNQNPDFLRHVWVEYSNICEQTVDNEGEVHGRNRAHLQITMLIHKALIFHEIGDVRRYGEELIDTEEYAYNMHFDEIVDAINAELDRLTN